MSGSNYFIAFAPYANSLQNTLPNTTPPYKKVLCPPLVSCKTGQGFVLNFNEWIGLIIQHQGSRSH